MIEFQYEISAEDNVSAAELHLSILKQRRSGWPYLLIGLACFVVPLTAGEATTVVLLLAGATGTYFCWIGYSWISYPRSVRAQHAASSVPGTTYKGIVSDSGIDVSGANRQWVFGWPAVAVKGENERLFLFTAEGILFIFAKRYLTPDQQAELRRLGGLAAPVGT